MYCRNCGNKLLPKAEICEVCGVKPPKGEHFCSSCGVEVLPLAERCIKCGAMFGKPPRPKAKTVAVLLAVFLGYWTWVYTYRKNTWKFWAGLVVGLPAFIIFNIGVIPHNSVEYDANGNYLGLGGLHFANNILIPALLIILIVRIWAIIDVCLKKQEWYLTYNWTVAPNLKRKSKN
jgi:Double zinc ribbon